MIIGFNMEWAVFNLTSHNRGIPFDISATRRAPKVEKVVVIVGGSYCTDSCQV